MMAGSLNLFPGIKTIIFLIILLPVVLSSQTFIELKEETNLGENQILIVMFQEITACNKCYIIPNNILECVLKNTDSSAYEVIALVNCNRDIELNIFRKNKNWVFPLLRDKNELKLLYGLDDKELIAVFDYDGKLIRKYPSGNPANDCHDLVELINNSLP